MGLRGTGQAAAMRRTWPCWLTAVVLAVGCNTASTKAIPTGVAEDCDPTADYERCDPGDTSGRQRCNPADSTWVDIGRCTTGLCKTFAWLGGAEGASATTCEAADASTGDATSPIATGGAGAIALADSSNGTSDADPADAADVAAEAGEPDAGTEPATCGNQVCEVGELATTCAWDCAPGAAAGAQCLIQQCPGSGQVCAQQATCPLALAQVWQCAAGCSGCLSSCLSKLAVNAIVFSVATCSGATCL